MRPKRIEPGPGQESVWDYPRPPSVGSADRRLLVVVDGRVLAESDRALKVCETSSPPTYYVPSTDVATDLLHESGGHSTYCEWKGRASYFDIYADSRRIARAGWTYRRPKRGYEMLRDHIAFYAGRVDEAWLDDERVQPQSGDFYGGWITSDIVGPFKGEAGTQRW